MELTTDVLLRGTAWDKAISSLGDIFKTRTNYSIYMLCVSIGVMYDKRIEKPDFPKKFIDKNPSLKIEAIV